MTPNLFKTWVSKKGLKATRQREEILKIFFHSPGHKNLGQIYSLVSKIDPKIGYTTVYRTLKLFTQLGLASQQKFADGETRYEPAPEGTHHDHLICLICGKIIEFEDPTLEALQKKIAQRHRFKISHHRMELYGRCEKCHFKKGKLS
ncbi:MAG: Fur family transcriptional regulator [Thermodesulfobacteriota bacterium]